MNPHSLEKKLRHKGFLDEGAMNCFIFRVNWIFAAVGYKQLLLLVMSSSKCTREISNPKMNPILGPTFVNDIVMERWCMTDILIAKCKVADTVIENFSGSYRVIWSENLNGLHNS